MVEFTPLRNWRQPEFESISVFLGFGTLVLSIEGTWVSILHIAWAQLRILENSATARCLTELIWTLVFARKPPGEDDLKIFRFTLKINFKECEALSRHGIESGTWWSDYSRNMCDCARNLPWIICIAMCPRRWGLCASEYRITDINK